MHPVAIVALASLAQVLTLAPNATFPALIPLFQEVWGLSNAEAGWISGIYYAGYVAGVPVLVTLTDSLDARRIYIGSALLAAAASLGFALLAEGFWSALALRALAGLGLAGTFMVGLRLVTDRIGGTWQSRGVAWYMAHFSIGLALSVTMAGEIAGTFGWEAAFAAAGLACSAAVVPILALPASRSPLRGGARRFDGHPLDLRPALRNRPALAYNLAYACHIWELFGWRAWLVAFLVFAFAWHGTESLGGLSAHHWASLLFILGLPASILGNEAALRWGRRRSLTAIMLVSTALATVLGFASALPLAFLLALAAVHAVFVMADSSSLTAGAVAAADPNRRGATLAVHSLMGFTLAFVSPLVAGLILDLAGGGDPIAWGLAFASLGIATAFGPPILARMGDPSQGER